jgi:2-desacetyl-2-hydroxyethyl bacteriochlorophyllide A dehydrogenase
MDQNLVCCDRFRTLVPFLLSSLLHKPVSRPTTFDPISTTIHHYSRLDLGMMRHAVQFDSPRQVSILEELLPDLASGHVRVRTQASLISTGTELLIYRGQAPAEMAVDAKIPLFEGEKLTYPLRYGYACVGEVTEVGEDVDGSWLARTVFAYHPHESSFNARPDELIQLPDGVTVDDALFLPMMETAVNLVQDGAPRIGETAIVTGLGIVGLLTTALLARMSLGDICAFDLHSSRREIARSLGATCVADPGDETSITELFERMKPHTKGADIAFELSGVPSSVNLLLNLTADSGRIIIGSWYGTKPAEINLGGRFHRSRIRIISSQVSTIDPELQGRWTVERRQQIAWKMINVIKPSRLITHRLPLQEAPQAYALLDGSPESTLAVAFDHISA